MIPNKDCTSSEMKTPVANRNTPKAYITNDYGLKKELMKALKSEGKMDISSRIDVQ